MSEREREREIERVSEREREWEEEGQEDRVRETASECASKYYKLYHERYAIHNLSQKGYWCLVSHLLCMTTMVHQTAHVSLSQESSLVELGRCKPS